MLPNKLVIIVGGSNKYKKQGLMQLQDKHRVAVLSAYALALHGFETLLPTPIPWLKLGTRKYHNACCPALVRIQDRSYVTLIRVVLASIFMAFSGPALFQHRGGLASVVAMGLSIKYFKNLFGTVGISLIGALFIT